MGEASVPRSQHLGSSPFQRLVATAQEAGLISSQDVADLQELHHERDMLVHSRDHIDEARARDLVNKASAIIRRLAPGDQPETEQPPARVQPYIEGGSAWTDLWVYREPIAATDIIGYSVEAIDGPIGKIDEASNEVGASYIVVDTGPWIFGKKVLLPAGIVDQVDTENETVYVNRTKDEIKNAPEFDETTYRESTYRDQLGTYYG